MMLLEHPEVRAQCRMLEMALAKGLIAGFTRPRWVDGEVHYMLRPLRPLTWLNGGYSWSVEQ